MSAEKEIPHAQQMLFLVNTAFCTFPCGSKAILAHLCHPGQQTIQVKAQGQHICCAHPCAQLRCRCRDRTSAPSQQRAWGSLPTSLCHKSLLWHPCPSQVEEASTCPRDGTHTWAGSSCRYRGLPRQCCTAAACGEMYPEGMKHQYWKGCVCAEHRPVKVSKDLFKVCSQCLACSYVKLTADKPWEPAEAPEKEMLRCCSALLHSRTPSSASPEVWESQSGMPTYFSILLSEERSNPSN